MGVWVEGMMGTGSLFTDTGLPPALHQAKATPTQRFLALCAGEPFLFRWHDDLKEGINMQQQA